MNILLSTNHLTGLTGSELFTFNIVKYLRKYGNEVIVHARFVSNDIKRRFNRIGIDVFNDLSKISDVKFDVIHIHHCINAILVRHTFRSTPMVFLSHGVLPFLEQPPPVEVNISRFMAVSEEVLRNLQEHGIGFDNISILRNMIDPELFFQVKKPNEVPKNAIILSYKIDESTENTIEQACLQRNIECVNLVKRFGPIDQENLPDLINKCDIVFSLGRGIMEAMFCGRAPIVIDAAGGDGLVTPGNFYNLATCNFSGRFIGSVCTHERLVDEIDKYNTQDCEMLRSIAIKNFSCDTQIQKLQRIYSDVIKAEPNEQAIDWEVIEAFVNNDEITKNFIDNLQKDNQSPFYKKIYWNIIEKIHK